MLPFRSMSAKRDHFKTNYKQYTENKLNFPEHLKRPESRNIHSAPWTPNNPPKNVI